MFGGLPLYACVGTTPSLVYTVQVPSVISPQEILDDATSTLLTITVPNSAGCTAAAIVGKATLSSFTIVNATQVRGSFTPSIGDAGNYYISVTNPAGTGQSTSTIFTITASG